MDIEELVRSSAVVLLTGRDGADRTSAALGAAARLAGHFPDGQLYANLRDEAPGAVARRFRHATASGRRVLVVLDDVASEAQVRPLLRLLENAHGCRTLLTSRTWLGGLLGISRVPVRSPLRAHVPSPRSCA